MKKISIEERVVRVNFTLDIETLKRIDENIARLQSWLIAHGAGGKEVVKVVNRSSVIRGLVKELGTERGYDAIRGSFCVALGVNEAQTDIFGK